MQEAEQLAQTFHEAYERLAPTFTYRTREESAVPWSEVPTNNKALMIATAQALLDAGYSLLTPGEVASRADIAALRRGEDIWDR